MLLSKLPVQQNTVAILSL